MRHYILILILLVSIISVHAISQEPYCYAASDFLVFKYMDFDPELTALYDNTKVYFDVNNDGVWEYQKTLRAYETYVADTNWELTDGSYIHSDKPIAYDQKAYTLVNSGKINENYQCIPPINVLGNELILYPIWANTPTWKIISPNSTITLFGPKGEVIEKEVEVSTTLNFPKSTSYEGIWYVNSTRPVIALAQWGFSSKLDTDFIKTVPGKTLIASIYADTKVYYDQNNDGIFDTQEVMGRGYKEIDLPAGTRIRSSKKIGAFERQWGNEVDYSPVIPIRSVNDELFVRIYLPGSSFITGLFNGETGFENTTYVIYEPENQESGEVSANAFRAIPATMGSGAARVKADKPVSSFYWFTSVTSYYRYQRPMQTIEPYITSFSRKKFLGLNDTAIINVRVINPTSYDLDNVKVTIRYLDSFSGSSIKYYISKRELDGDEYVEGRIEKSAAPLDLGAIKEFTITIDSLGKGEYVDIDYYLRTPENIGNYLFPSASMEYNAEIWNYD